MKKSATGDTAGFSKLLVQDKELSRLRAEYAQRSATQRRAAAEWAYDENFIEEAEPILEKAVRLASPDYTLPSNNLMRMRQVRRKHAPKNQP